MTLLQNSDYQARDYLSMGLKTTLNPFVPGAGSLLQIVLLNNVVINQ